VELLLVGISLLLLLAGAEGLVRGSSSLALRAGLSPLVVGLTVVAFGTSSPELVVSIKAALSDQGDLAVGNVVGSNIFNVGLILGLTALICPVPVKLQLIKLDVPFLIVVSFGTLLVLRDGAIGRSEGGILLAILAAYTALNFYLVRKERSAEIVEEFSKGLPTPKSWGMDLLLIGGGLALLIFGSKLLVENASSLARSIGISEAVIGLTIVAAGTSMPELATSVIAALRREPDIAVGNVVGSNTFNLLGILGGAALVTPIRAAGITMTDYAAMILFAILLLPLLWSGLRIRRLEGALLLLIYCVYMALIWPKPTG
jgi:cation:H+ antiporter